MTMYTFRLNRGSRFQWLKNGNEAIVKNGNEAIVLNIDQYRQLMAGFPLTGTIKESYPALESA